MQVSQTQALPWIDALPQIVWQMGTDGFCSGCNQRWLDYCGLEREQGLGQVWRDCIHPDDSARVVRLFATGLDSGAPFEMDFRLRGADGVHRWMLARALPQAPSPSAPWLVSLTDVDGLKQTAERLEKNLAMNRIAGRVALLGGWTIDLPERVLTWSDENCLIHDVPPGYTPTLQEGISYFLPQDRPRVIRYVEACAEFGTPYEFVLPKLTAKGRQIWVRSIGEAVRDADGKIVRLQGAFQDITEQKRAEARLLALEAQLLTTLESITDGFWLLDKDWKLIFMNGPAERMLKRSRDDLLGKSIWLEFPEICGTVVDREFREAVATPRTAQFENFYPPLDQWFEVHAYPTEAGLAVYFQSITQRRQAQAQLRLLETAVARLNDMVVILEAQAQDKSGPRIVFVNDAFERQTGYRRAEAIGSTPELLWGPKTSRTELERIRTAMTHWQAVRAEILIYTKSGQELWLETDIAPIADETGRFTHWVSVERDITERRRQQREILSLNTDLEARVLLRTAQLVAANKELESFAYSVSHDLRSPLNTVDGFSRLLLKIDAENISDKGKHYLNRIGVGVKHMGELIEGLLTLAHLSREQLRSEVVDISALVRRLDASHREQQPGRQVRLTVQDGMRARGDPRLLAAVFQNLLDNAWKFTARTAVAQIDVGCDAGDSGDPVFFVRDNGAGFNMAFAHKLFGTFERLHSPDDFPGTGIGLATVKRVIDRHGGRVWAQSKPDEGATFYFTLGQAPSSQP